MSERRPRLYSIPAGTAFLPRFADALLNGELIEGFGADRSNPLALASATIYVPTRRAGRALRSLLVDRNPANSALLPSIRPLGDVEESAALFDSAAAEFLQLAPPMSEPERLLLLAQLVRPWRESLPSHIRALFGTEDIAIPATTADAIWLARDLVRLMDQVETEGASWTELGLIAPDELADWWRVTLQFLEIVTRIWPDVLRERNRSNASQHRNWLIDFEIQRMIKNPPQGPVIVAGSTGSIPATAKLVATIARLPKGAVVFPGLDRDLDDKAWTMLSDGLNNPSTYGHPQYGLRKLLDHMQCRREDVQHLEAADTAKRMREYLVSEALRPAETTDQWGSLRLDPQAVQAAMHNVSLIETANEREEALAVSLALREAIDAPDKTAALVTVDRNLARRVVLELTRFGIDADDSGGKLLRDMDAAILLRLLIKCVFEPGDPVALLALAKHPLVRLGQKRGDLRRSAEMLELVALRGGTGRADIADLRGFLDRKLEEAASKIYAPAWQNNITVTELEHLHIFCDAMSEAVAPLTDMIKIQARIEVPQIVRACTQVLENLARDIDGTVHLLYQGQQGEQFGAFLRQLIAADTGLDFLPEEWPDMLEALMANEIVKPHPGGHPRVFIWGALEARLQTVDTVVIGGINEGIWPAKTRNDPFMSRPMKGMIALDPPEVRTGLAAHDFAMSMGMEQVIFSRSQRSESAPTVPSRWLQRLETVVGKHVTAMMRKRGGKYLHWARLLDVSPDVPFVSRPEPKPPVEARPKRFSVTEIETLRRDPYAIYAKKILKLRALEPLIRDPAAAERGTLFHDILAEFTRRNIDPVSPQAPELLLEIGRGAFTDTDLPPEIEAVWWPRFTSMIPEFLGWERERAHQIRERHAEIASEPVLVEPLDITLSGRADRIDVLRDGTTVVIDYKTGSTPSVRQAHVLLSPQLALEAALLRRGAFKDIGTSDAEDLLYVRLQGGGRVKPESILISDRGASIKTAVQLGEEAWMRLGELLAEYNREEQGYRSRALPFRESDLTGDYDHLARVLEWSAGGSDADGSVSGDAE
ncbi:double-strand break repair protein AddB [Pseudochrobactrum sp. MP213Fo]|uniref:double-strand break repair protein AddB n=1 Tax=Pseudochrobactrum sp. MP213Fo TaxID=3022250 RepID=UPI003BA352D2